MKPTEKAIESASPLPGRAVSRCADAAGATSSAKISSVPTICTVSATASATISRKSVESKRTGTPAASATSGSTEAKNSGRAITASASSPITAVTAVTTTSRSVMPRIVPNRKA